MFVFLSVVCILLLSALAPGHSDEPWFTPVIVMYLIACALSAAAFLSLCGFQTYLQWTWGVGTMDWMTKRHQAAVQKRRQAREAAALDSSNATTPTSSNSETVNAVTTVHSQPRGRAGATAPSTGAFQDAQATGDSAAATQPESAEENSQATATAHIQHIDDASGHVGDECSPAELAAAEATSDTDVEAQFDDSEAPVQHVASPESEHDTSEQVQLPLAELAQAAAGQEAAANPTSAWDEESAAVVRSQEMSNCKRADASEVNGKDSAGAATCADAPPFVMQSTASIIADTPPTDTEAS